MSINALGYVALRALGPKVGLALAGLFSGFVSSTATIGAMGLAAIAYAALFTLRSVRETPDGKPPAGRPFDPKAVLLFVLVVGLALVISAALSQWLGDRG
jgi:uncharacterized membrane protein (DUF4010 family)